MMQRFIAPVAVAASLAISAGATAQAQPAQPHSLGGYVGLTDRKDADLTIGAEYEYRLQQRWGLGAVLEWTPDAFPRDNDATLLMGTANFYPVERLKLIGGLGVEFTDFDDELRGRIGASYDVFTPEDQGFYLTPRLSLDFGDRDEAVGFGARLGFPF